MTGSRVVKEDTLLPHLAGVCISLLFLAIILQNVFKV